MKKFMTIAVTLSLMSITPYFQASLSVQISLVRETGHGIPGFYLGSIDIADFDGDGRVDLVIAGSWDRAHTRDMSNLTCVGKVRLYKNISISGSQVKFTLQKELNNVVVCGGALAAGDLNGDGYPEIAVGGNSDIPFGTHDCTKNLMYGQVH